MVMHPAEYPWSSYHANALGISVELNAPHNCYQDLGTNYKERQVNYFSLFNIYISAYTVEEIRDSLNKTWVLGDIRFKSQIKEQSGRRVAPLPRGGDRKSEKFRNQHL